MVVGGAVVEAVAVEVHPSSHLLLVWLLFQPLLVGFSRVGEDKTLSHMVMMAEIGTSGKVPVPESLLFWPLGILSQHMAVEVLVLEREKTLDSRTY